MGKLIIERSSEWNNKLLEMELYLNDSKLKNISDGEVRKIELEPGEYRLEAKLGLWRSKPLFIKMSSNTVKKIQLSGLSYGQGFLIFCLSIITVIILNKADLIQINLFWLTMVPLLGFTLFYLTLGRKSYLRLME